MYHGESSTHAREVHPAAAGQNVYACTRLSISSAVPLRSSVFLLTLTVDVLSVIDNGESDSPIIIVLLFLPLGPSMFAFYF